MGQTETERWTEIERQMKSMVKVRMCIFADRYVLLNHFETVLLIS